jgi:hypothetical protein
MFKPNRKFFREYDRMFRRDPLAANTFLLLSELADKNGRVETDEKEIATLLAIRFDNPREYQL